jgi:hypothetical protein
VHVWNIGNDKIYWVRLTWICNGSSATSQTQDLAIVCQVNHPKIYVGQVNLECVGAKKNCMNAP